MITGAKEQTRTNNKNIQIAGKDFTKVKDRDPLTEGIIASAYKIHSELGPGFNEKVYHNALKLGLEGKGLKYETEKEFRVVYSDKQVGTLRVDLVVEDKIIVEVKAASGFMPKVFETQVLSYLKVTGYNVGLLINFGNKSCQVRRMISKSLQSL